MNNNFPAPPVMTANAERLELKLKVSKAVEGWKSHMLMNFLKHAEFRDKIPATDIGSIVYSCFREEFPRQGMVLEHLAIYPIGLINNEIMLRQFCFFVKLEEVPSIIKA